MASASIPVDLFNPGQVFACLGLVETADNLLGGARGGFDWNAKTGPVFHLFAQGEASPVRVVLDFLEGAEIKSIAPAGSAQSTAKWKVPTTVQPEESPFPFPDPSTAATLPAVLFGRTDNIVQIEHWGEVVARTGRDAVKFWAGAGGYPGAALAADALNLVRDRLSSAADNPFSISAPQSSSFRFDWRRDYIPMDVGFSPNEHAGMTMVGFPIVELLAAIGLSNARPQRLRRLAYRYAVVSAPDSGLLDPMFLRAAVGVASLPFPRRVFRMNLGWPGQEGQGARCITDVIEEP